MQTLRQVRRKRGLTLAQLAEASGLSESHLSRVERGERNLSVEALRHLASFLGLSMDYVAMLCEQDERRAA